MRLSGFKSGAEMSLSLSRNLPLPRSSGGDDSKAAWCVGVNCHRFGFLFVR